MNLTPLAVLSVVTSLLVCERSGEAKNPTHLPTLSQENYAEVKHLSLNEPVDVLLVMDSCIPCEVIKGEVPNTTYLVHQEKQPETFRRISQGRIRQFPTLAVLHKGKALFYIGANRIRDVFNSRPPRFK